jgi:hypothetical protein
MTESKVNLSTPVIPSVPTMAGRDRKTGKDTPENGSSGYSRDHVNPSRVRAKYSGGPNWRAKLAIKGVATIMTKTLKIPPMAEAMMKIHRALAACPCLARACPSMTVHTAEGSPGIPKRTEVMDPPVIPPQ